MGMKIVKLDNRYYGSDKFKYCLEFHHPYRDGNEFCQIREWCWATWGASRELKFVSLMTDTSNVKWAFMTEENRTRIYIKGDEELSWCKLRWL